MDTVKALATYAFVFVTLGMAFYGLVLYPFELSPLVQGALIAWGGSVIAFVTGQEIAKATAAASQRAYDKGVTTPTPVTIEAPPVTVTTGTPPENVP